MANTMHIEITDNSGEVKEEFEAACLRALETCGLTAEGCAKKLCPVDTGNLRNSITHQVDPGEPAAYIVQPPTPVNFPTNCCGQFIGWGNNGCGSC